MTTPSVDYNQWLKRVDTQLNKLTNQNSPQSLCANENENVTIKLWRLV